jgi:predicted phosphodiesterase
MRYLVLSDIHANMDALEAVLRASAIQKYDRVLVLGDLVGYGPDPNAVIERIRLLGPAGIVRGNHDKAAAGVADTEDFNAVARDAAEWTARTLTPENRRYLADLPRGPLLVDDRVEVCHGSPLDEDLYIFDDREALRALRASRCPLCLFGHTHVAVVLRTDGQKRVRAESPQGRPELEIAVHAGEKCLINPGSVGQPRDGDSRAAYGIADLDQGQVLLHRVGYPIGIVQAKILAAGLPSALAHRLGMGR